MCVDMAIVVLVYLWKCNVFGISLKLGVDCV